MRARARDEEVIRAKEILELTVQSEVCKIIEKGCSAG